MRTKQNIAVLVSGGGTNLQALLDAERDGQIPHGTIRLVISNRPGVRALERAAERNVDHMTVVRKDFDSQSAFENAMQAALEDHAIDLIVLAGFLAILSRDFTDRWKKRIINIHPSLIPSFCGPGFYGLRVHEAALARGVKITGATVHYVNEIPDGGEIILQKAVHVLPGDTPEVLQRRVMEEAEWLLLPRAAEQVCSLLSSQAD